MDDTTKTSVDAPIQAVIFDMYGVLVDSEPLLFEAERILLAELGVELTEEAKKPFIGMGGHEVLQALLDHFGLEADLAALGRHKLEIYLELARTVPGFAPTAELSRALHADGIPLAIASGSSPGGIAICLAAIGLTEQFPVQVSVSSVARGKPAPDVFLAAAEQLGVDPANCLVVEDAIHGIEAAQAAGMRVIAIPSVTDPLDPAADDPDHAAARVSVVSSRLGRVLHRLHPVPRRPPLLGMLADHVGYRTALLTMTIPLVASVLLSPASAPPQAEEARAEPDRADRARSGGRHARMTDLCTQFVVASGSLCHQLRSFFHDHPYMPQAEEQ